MFQRIKGAIDRTIAEEQARQKAFEQSAASPSGTPNPRRTGPGRRTKDEKPGLDPPNDNILTADPAVFEAAFVIDDSDEPSRAASPKPDSPPKPDNRKESVQETEVQNDGLRQDKTQVSATDKIRSSVTTESDPRTDTSLELSSDIKQRMRKLDKLEATYPELLRSYRVAHRRVIAIEPFEKALRENTPLTSISDPAALVEYLNQLNLRGDMVMDELKRISSQKDELKRLVKASEDKLHRTEAELAIAKSGSVTHLPLKSCDSDLFSYDEESSQDESKGFSVSNDIQRLENEVISLQEQLEIAKKQSENIPEDGSIPKDGRIDQDSPSLASLHQKLDFSKEEIASLTKKLELSHSKLEELGSMMDEEQNAHRIKVADIEASLITYQERVKKQDTQLAKASTAKQISAKLVDDLGSQVAALRTEKSAVEKKLEDLTKRLELLSQTQPTTVGTNSLGPNQIAVTPGHKKKNKRKKGKGGPATATDGMHIDSTDVEEANYLKSETERLKQELFNKDVQIENLSKRRKTEEDLREEIESLRENLIDIGQDHVVAKEKIKSLETEKIKLKDQITNLEHRVENSSESDTNAANEAQEKLETLKKECDNLRLQSETLQSDLGAAQHLAQTRFKDLNEAREALHKLQPELKTLRQNSALLKSKNEDLLTIEGKLKDVERKEKELRRDLSRSQQLASDRESDFKTFQEKLAKEINLKTKYENAQRVVGRDLRKSELEKTELKIRADGAEQEAVKAQEELSKLRPSIKALEDQLHKLRREKSTALEGIELKGQQYANAQGLLSSMRDQTAEMSVQLKESKSQREALEEELLEVQRLLQERTREGETMRRLLADVDERADSKVRDMHGKMETALEERDRMEDDYNTQVRKRSREVEELRGKMRELEREIKILARERDALEKREKDCTLRRDELEFIQQNAEVEAAEVQSTVTQLRIALDASESHVHDMERQRTELRRSLEELQVLYDRASKEVALVHSKLPGRSSMDSTRSGVSGGGVGDTMYLKTIMLQFLEQRDKRLRSQLVPVLGKLLKFDKADEVKWLNAVQHIDVR